MDGSITWVFNYLFNSGLKGSEHIIFPHGPLAFVMYPVPIGFNLEIAMGFHVLLAGLLSINIYHLVKNQRQGLVLAPVILWLILAVVNLQLLIIAVLMLAFANSIQSGKWHHSLWYIPLVAISLFIKSYVGILSLILCLSLLVISLIVTRKIWFLIVGVGCLLLSILLVYWLMFADLSGLPHYFFGISQLAGDNSIAVSYYPNNNWWVLSVFIGLSLLPWLIWKKKRVFFFYLLVLPLLFAGWKHGMSRQDMFHAGQFLRLILLVTLFSFLYFRGLHRLASVSLLMGCLAFYINFHQVEAYEEFDIDLWTPDNLAEQFSDFITYKSDYLELSQKRCSVNKLPDDMLAAISRQTVDVYPWDYSVVPANALNWRARPVLQSYAAYSSWLDSQNKEHFKSEQAPKYLLWEIDKLYQSRYQENMSGIDGRYLLNDEPQTILEILNRYSVVKSMDRFLLLSRNNQHAEISISTKPEKTTSWNQWIPVPKKSQKLQRLRVHIQPSLLGKIRSLFYKAGEVFIYYQLEDLSILSYKIVPKNARDGLWINPLVMDWDTRRFPDKVVAVQFRTSRLDLVEQNIPYQFEDIDIDAPLLSYFQNQKTNFDSISVVDNRSENPFRILISELVQQHQKPVMLAENEYHPVWQSNIDSIIQSNNASRLALDLETWIKTERHNKAVAVLSLEKNGESMLWQQKRLSDFVINEYEWNYFRGLWELDLTEFDSHSHAKLKLFIWNPESSVVELRQLRLRVYADSRIN